MALLLPTYQPQPFDFLLSSHLPGFISFPVNYCIIRFWTFSNARLVLQASLAAGHPTLFIRQLSSITHQYNLDL